MTTTTNDTSEKTKKKTNLLDTIHENWVKSGSKLPSREEGKRLATKVAKAYEKIDQIEASLLAARAEASEVTLELAKAFGRSRFELPNLGNCMLTCRENKVMLRFESTKERISFG